MSISAANLEPNWALWPSIEADDLRRVEEPCVIFEWFGYSEDNEPSYLYSVGGRLDGQALGDGMGSGVSVGGQPILVHADSREEADYIAGSGLLTTIETLYGEQEAYIEAEAAKARLAMLNPVQRLEQATKPAADKSDEFVRDVDAIRPLIGDDIVLAGGGVEH